MNDDKPKPQSEDGQPGRGAEAMEQGAGLPPPTEDQPKAKTEEAKALRSDLSDLNEANEKAD